MKRVGAVLGSMEEGSSPLHRRLAEARALEAWPELVGPHLAKLTRPLRIAGGRLFVIAHGSALRQELMFHRRDILRKVNRAAEGTVARELVFLESDANLSSLIQWDEDPVPRERAKRNEEPARRGSDASDANADTGSAGGAATDENEREPLPYEPVVPPFDAAAYREEMARIAHPENGERKRK